MEYHIISRQLLLILFFVSLQWSAAAKDFILVKDSKPEAVIVLDGAAAGKLDGAIRFFNTELKRCTKTSLPVASEVGKDQNRIVFRIEKRPLNQEDAFSIDFPDPRTMCITGTAASIRWALNHLLEKELGIRWLLPPLKGLYGPEINHYPQLKTASVSATTPFSGHPAAWVSRIGGSRIAGFALHWNAQNRIKFVH